MAPGTPRSRSEALHYPDRAQAHRALDGMERLRPERAIAQVGHQEACRIGRSAMVRARARNRIVKPAVTGSRSGPLPDFVVPCLARRQKQVPEGAQWVHEIKLDGYRLQARLDNGNAKLITRNN